MGAESVQRPILELVESQHGVVARAQLLALGLSPKAIRHAVSTGRLHPSFRGVYAFGRPRLTREGRWMAAVLSCGDGAALSHGSAAALFEMRPDHRAAIEISLSVKRLPRRGDIVIHRRSGLIDADFTVHRGVPVTTPVCTLVDLAARLSRGQLERAINEADKRDLLDPETLRSALERFAGRPGVAAIRELLDRRTFALTDSELERRFLPIARRAGLRQPRTGCHVNGFRVDFYWPDLGLVVETDGLRYHRTPAQQAKDRHRDQVHTAAGMVSLRFTHAQVRFQPKQVESTLRRVTTHIQRLNG